MSRSIISPILFLYGFVATGMPLSRVEIGPMPLYFIDVLALCLLLAGHRHLFVMYNRHRKLSFIILLFIIALLPTTISELLRMRPLEPFYLLGRTVLHILAVWTLSGFLRDDGNLRRVITGFACGILLTALIATLNSLPVTGPFVRAHIFSIDMIMPTRGTDLDAEILLKLDKGVAERGNSLLGKSNITGCVLATMLPFLYGALRNIRLGRATRLLFNTSIAVAFFAILFTYSRSSYLALAMLFFGYMIYDRKALSKRMLPLAVLAVVVIAAVGIQSESFKFTFLMEKFDLTNERFTYTNQARLYAYIVPFQTVYEHPQYLFRGSGIAHRKLRVDDEDAAILQILSAEQHSVFSASIFFRGFLSMLLIFAIYLTMLRMNHRAIQRGTREHNPFTWLPIASMLSLLALMPYWAVTHFLVDKLSGHMYLFLIFAMFIASYDRYITARNETDDDDHDTVPAKRDTRILARARGT